MTEPCGIDILVDYIWGVRVDFHKEKPVIFCQSLYFEVRTPIYIRTSDACPKEPRKKTIITSPSAFRATGVVVRAFI
jgi:hypothetical protein